MATIMSNVKLSKLQAPVYNDLIDCLNQDSAWKTVAFFAAKESKCERFPILVRKWETRREQNPAEKILQELEARDWTIERLSSVLRRCKLQNALSVIHNPEPMEITRQPNHVVEVVKIDIGETLCLTCEAIGLPPPEFVWCLGEEELPDQKTGQLKITINNVNQEGRYRCKVSQYDRDGRPVNAMYSECVHVEIKPMPVEIITQPVDSLVVEEGGEFTLWIEAKSHPSPRFQWYFSGKKMKGQTEKVLTVEHFTEENAGEYKCLVSNDKYNVRSQGSNVMMRQMAERKVAILFGNQTYPFIGKLDTPENDAATLMQILLESLGFEVWLHIDCTLKEMQDALETFCEHLTKGVYGLIYFAGHGFGTSENYMLPVDAPVNFRYEHAFSEGKLLAMALKGEPKLLVVILDMCRNQPGPSEPQHNKNEQKPEIYNEVAPVDPYINERNLIRAYSTSGYRPSYEEQFDGLYMKYLSRHITKDIPVLSVFNLVAEDFDRYVKEEEKRNQIPELISTVPCNKNYRLTDKIKVSDKADLVTSASE